MNRAKLTSLLMFAGTCVPVAVHAQGAPATTAAPVAESVVDEATPLDVYGYFQAKYAANYNGVAEKFQSNFVNQQLNLFLTKGLGGDFSSLVNLQWSTNFSTLDNWGTFKVSDAWLKWAPDEAFKVKTGLLVPKFGHFNEIKDKTPLQPYIWRPLVFESTLAPTMDLTAFVPNLAMAQVEGTISTGATKFDYAVFGGNSDFLVSQAGFAKAPGNDTSNNKMVGGRLGLRTGNGTVGRFDIGVSSTYDQTTSPFLGGVVNIYNIQVVPAVNTARAKANLPALPTFAPLHSTERIRLGGDLTWTGHGLTLESEVIKVLYNLDDAGQAALDALHKSQLPNVKGTIGTSLDKTFYTANLTYDLQGRADKFFVTGGWSYLQDETYTGGPLQAVGEGTNLYCAGGGFRPNDRVSIKLQLVKIVDDMNSDHSLFDLNQVLVATSVFF